MAAVKQVVELSDKEIKDCLIEKAKQTINNGKETAIQGSTKVELEDIHSQNGDKAE